MTRGRLIAAAIRLWVLAGLFSAGLLAQQHERRARYVRFSGYDWWVKSSAGRVGPGPNRFSDSSQSVLVDGEGRLHLKIIRDRYKTWMCSEIVSERTFGYGTYRFWIGSVADMDINAVLGLFTWSDTPAYHHREIDIEVSRWSDSSKPNAQFVIQPYQASTNLSRFELPPALPGSIHEFSWLEDRVLFSSRGVAADSILHGATMDIGIPKPGGENVRLNLWLNRGKPPATEAVEVIVNSFEFLPAISAEAR